SEGLYESLNCARSSGDRAEHVRANRAQVAAALDLAPENILTLKQVHGARAITVSAPWGGDSPEGDALATATPGIGLGVLTADCVPVLLASRKDRIVAAAHAGWKGALGGVIEAAVAAMENLGAKRQDIAAAIGPCIGPQSYEVGADFPRPFVEQDARNMRFFRPAARQGHVMFDLPGYAADRLNKAGIAEVYDVRQDTLANEAAYFSYRRACQRGETDYGRQISVIAIR